MRIGFVLDALALGGTERQFCLLAEGLSQQGHDVHLLALSHSASETERMVQSLGATGVRLYVSKFGSRGVASSLNLKPLIRRWVSTVNPDVVHAAMSRSTVAAGVLAGRRGWPPTVASRRSLVSARRDSTPMRLLRTWSIRRVDAVVANSLAVAQDSASCEGVPRARYTVIPNIVPDEAFVPGNPQPVEAHGAVVIDVANLRSAKGHRILVEALALLRDAGFETTTILVGDGPLREEISRASQRCELDVQLVGSVEDVRPYLASADLFVQASLEEGMSNALLEAMAVGLPIVATDVGGTREAIGDDGLLVPAGDARGLAGAMQEVLSEPDVWRGRSIERARQFAPTESVQAHLRLYGHLVTRSGLEQVVN